ncbi:MAG: autotransporter domain-containing protein, partial [Bradyrhizobium sp.]|nr:autotransporter domain-containing protein [Bradyrhizobium sp.]
DTGAGVQGGAGGSTPFNCGGGGGGGGAGVTGGGGGGGGVGTAGNAGTGGAGGASAGANGQAGADGGGIFGNGDGGAGGGGGGAHGAVVTTSTSNAGSLSGGKGGNGGNAGFGPDGPAGAGGGGAGGYGVVVNGSGLTYTNGGVVSGGNGGLGGSTAIGGGGFGGDGGEGIVFTGGGTLVNSSSIAGGNGGAGGIGGTAGLAGQGGVGIVSANLTVINSGSISGGLYGDGSTRAYAIQFTGGHNVLELQAGSTITGTVIGAGDTLELGGTINSTFDVSAIATQYIGFGTFVKTGTGTWTLTGTTTQSTPWTINQGILAVSSDTNLGLPAGVTFNGGVLQFLAGFSSSRTVTLNAGGGSFDTNGNNVTLSGTIGGSGSLTKVGSGTLTLTASNTYAGGTAINAGTLLLSGIGTLGATTASTTVNSGGTLDLGGTTQTQAALFLAGGTLQNGSLNAPISSTGGTINGIGGTASLAVTGGTTVINGNNTYAGGTVVNAGTLLLSGVGTLGATTASTTVNSGGTLDLGGTTQTQAALHLAGGTLQNGSLNAPISSTGGTINGIGGTASLAVTAGTTVINGNNTYTGGTSVTNATLTVNGSLSDPTIGASGILNGTGSVGDTTIQSGGTLAPGNAGNPAGTLTVTGNLAFQSGAVYLVQVAASGAASTAIAGTAALSSATVNAVFANGNYWLDKTSTILTASGGVHGTFGRLVTNLSANFTPSLSYDAKNVYLSLTLNYTPGSNPSPSPGSNPTPSGATGGMSGNQQAVANTLVNFFNSNAGIPIVFSALSAAGLTQVSGELATASQQTTFDAMNQFLGLLTDPFVGRGNGINGATSSPTGFAEESAEAYAASRKKSDAYAMFTKAPPAVPFVQRWSVWAAGYGGSQMTDGNAVVGSNDTRSSIFGTAVGADYLFSPNTLAGFALAGGGTNFSVNTLGSGRSDLFQAGAYVRHTEGAAYIAGALAYGWQDITTNRTVTAAGLDELRAEFNANAYSGRVEGGYRFVAPVIGGIGITPYAAGQFTTFDLPAYAESVVTGTPNFALAYGAKSVTDTRSELGFRTDKSFAMANGILTLRGRLAWAHDFDPDRSIAATFQSLPGASFVVNGAAQASDSALTTASLEMKWMNGWSAAATFEGEFSDVTRSYAGKGVVRYAW